MKDRLKHVEKSPFPGFGQMAMTDLIGRATGVTGNHRNKNLPNTPGQLGHEPPPAGSFPAVSW